MIQDIEPKHLYNEWKKNAVPKKSSAVVQFRGQDLLCRIDDNGLKFPSRAQFTEPDEAFTYLFELDGREYYLLFDENERALDGYSYRNIGLFRTEKPKELAYAAVSAWHLCSWYRDARYCGRCGEKLVHDGNERMMRCPKCGNMIFPRINPSVIVAVTHGDYLLLTKYANRPGAQRTALVAGFTEFAESFEQTVHREVMEEVGLKVKDLRYYRCQPWGISGNIMMGYWCRLDGDDDTIHLDNFELADGAWVSREELRENYTGNGIALTLFIAEPLVGLFTPDAAVAAAGGQYLRGYIWDSFFAGVQFSFSGYFCACGKSGISFLHNSLSILLVRVPGAYLASKYFPQTLLPMGLANAAGSLFSILVCVIAYAILTRREKRAQEAT